MDDLRLVQDLHGLAYDGWSRREEEGCCNGGTLAAVEVLSRLRRSKNNETGFIGSIYSDGLSLLKGKEDGDRLLKSFLTSRAVACNILGYSVLYAAGIMALRLPL